jgi:hypothetical protein
MVRPSAWAVFRLMTNSNFIGCSTGKSLGLVPLRILGFFAQHPKRTHRREVVV